MSIYNCLLHNNCRILKSWAQTSLDNKYICTKNDDIASITFQINATGKVEEKQVLTYHCRSILGDFHSVCQSEKGSMNTPAINLFPRNRKYKKQPHYSYKGTRYSILNPLHGCSM